MADLSNDTDMAVEQSTDNKSDGDLSSGDAHQRSPHANAAATKTETQIKKNIYEAEQKLIGMGAKDNQSAIKKLKA